MKTCLDCTHLYVAGCCASDGDGFMVNCEKGIWPDPLDHATSDLLRSLSRARNCKFFAHQPGPDFDGRVGEFV